MSSAFLDALRVKQLPSVHLAVIDEAPPTISDSLRAFSPVIVRRMRNSTHLLDFYIGNYIGNNGKHSLQEKNGFEHPAWTKRQDDLYGHINNDERLQDFFLKMAVSFF